MIRVSEKMQMVELASDRGIRWRVGKYDGLPAKCKDCCCEGQVVREPEMCSGSEQRRGKIVPPFHFCWPDFEFLLPGLDVGLPF